jgi:hypothetical protein
VFAFGSSNVSIVRMRVEISDPDGAIPGNYGSQVVWKGNVQQWNEKVMALNERAKTLNLGPGGNACLNAVTECEAQRINVFFMTDQRLRRCPESDKNSPFTLRGHRREHQAV